MAALLEPSKYDVFTPGDACPDNNLFTPDGLRFIDFEFSGVYSLFFDAGFVVAPFPTCWCVLEAPDTASKRAAAAYRTEVVTSFPELVDDDRWNDGLARACALWTAMNIRRLSRTTPGDLSDNAWDRGDVRFPGLIIECRYRLGRVIDIAGTVLPAFTDLARQLRDRLESESAGQDLTMPAYPAFRHG